MIFDQSWLDFVDDDTAALATVNPSLWRQAQVMRRGGLFKAVDHRRQADGEITCCAA